MINRFTRPGPRRIFYPKGDWSTRIPGLNPFMPAVNSKAARRALHKADEMARRQIAAEKKREEEEKAAAAARRLGGERMEDEGAEGAAERRAREAKARWSVRDQGELNR